MTRYRKKPIEIEAVQFTGDNDEDIAKFMKDHDFIRGVDTASTVQGIPVEYYDYIEIPTLEGKMKAVRGDWIIKGVKGEFYPCKPDIFDETYEFVDGRQKLPNTECPVCHGVLEDEYKPTIFADFHRMGCFKCGYTIIFEDQINVPEEIHKQRIDMLPDMIRDIHRNRE